MTDQYPLLRELMVRTLRKSAHAEIEAALLHTLDESKDDLAAIERCFTALPLARRSPEELKVFFASWHCTHLKMMAIYGLSCRLQRAAEASASVEGRALLYSAASLNAQTSHEDLGLDFDGVTHAALFDRMVAGFLPDDAWKLSHNQLESARCFREWIYKNMVIENPVVGLFTNLFSEIYNHAEYSLALVAFSDYCRRWCDLSPGSTHSTLEYIRAHVEDDTEEAHFMCVVEAIDTYARATGSEIDYDLSKQVFRDYLRQLGGICRQIVSRFS